MNVTVRSTQARFLDAMALAAMLVLLAPAARAQEPGGSKIADGTESAWSPDGEWILMSVLSDDQRDLYAVRPDGSALRQITDSPESELLATWSPEGRIAFVKPIDNRLELFVMEEPLEVSRQSFHVRLPDYRVAFTSAPWTPDGKALAVVVGEQKDLDIYRVPVDGSTPSPLVVNAGYDSSPAWSRDGALAFVSDRGGSRDIWVQRQDGSLHAVTMTSATDDSPAWSPDGRLTAFVSDRTGSREIYMVPAEGGTPTRLTNHGAWAAYPTWSPDGSTLGYVLVTSGRGNDQLMTVAVPETGIGHK